MSEAIFIIIWAVTMAALINYIVANGINRRRADNLAVDNRKLREVVAAQSKAVYHAEIAVRAAHRQLNALGQVPCRESYFVPDELIEDEWPEMLEK